MTVTALAEVSMQSSPFARMEKPLTLDRDGNLKIGLRDVIGESIAILGIKGSGKTNTAAVLIEELLAAKLPMTIVDIEGEYYGLKERYDLFVIGQSANADISLGVEHAAALARFSVMQGVSLILDMSEFDQDAMQEFLLAYFEALWVAASQAKQPYQVVLEEAHEFVPEGTRTPLKTLLTRFALRGRKRGLGLITISQRSAKVSKDVLTQAGLQFLHRVVHPTDLKVYSDILPLPPRQVEERVGALQTGDALVLFKHTVTAARMRIRYTFHAGATPEMGAENRPALRKGNEALLAELRKLSAAPTATAQPIADQAVLQGTIKLLRAELEKRNAELAERDKRIAHLEEELRVAANIKAIKDLLPKAAPTSNATASMASRPVATNQVGSQQPAAKAAPMPAVKPADPIMGRKQARFDRLVKGIQAQPRMHRDLLVYLATHTHPRKWYGVKELNRALGYAPEVIQKNPPTPLTRMGLIERRYATSGHEYKSMVAELFAEMFDTDSQHFADELLKALGSK